MGHPLISSLSLYDLLNSADPAAQGLRILASSCTLEGSHSMFRLAAHGRAEWERGRGRSTCGSRGGPLAVILRLFLAPLLSIGLSLLMAGIGNTRASTVSITQKSHWAQLKVLRANLKVPTGHRREWVGGRGTPDSTPCMHY
jgi:hypothetical protein